MRKPWDRCCVVDGMPLLKGLELRVWPEEGSSFELSRGLEVEDKAQARGV